MTTIKIFFVMLKVTVVEKIMHLKQLVTDCQGLSESGYQYRYHG